MASSRGVIAGRLLLQEPNQEVVDCSACGSSGYAISGDLNLLDKLVMKTDACYIIVVEKHAIFQRLAEDCVYNQIPSILITAKGYPDIATRLMPKLALSAPEKKKLTGRVFVVLKACSDLKFGSPLLDFECHFNETLEKKM